MLCSLDDGKNKNIFLTATSTEKRGRKEKYYRPPTLPL